MPRAASLKAPEHTVYFAKGTHNRFPVPPQLPPTNLPVLKVTLFEKCQGPSSFLFTRHILQTGLARGLFPSSVHRDAELHEYRGWIYLLHHSASIDVSQQIPYPSTLTPHSTRH